MLLLVDVLVSIVLLQERCGLMPLLEEFQGQVSKVQARGDTALYDSIQHGTAMLQRFHQTYPSARQRLLVLSDGEDSVSAAKAHQVRQ